MRRLWATSRWGRPRTHFWRRISRICRMDSRSVAIAPPFGSGGVDYPCVARPDPLPDAGASGPTPSRPYFLVRPPSATRPGAGVFTMDRNPQSGRASVSHRSYFGGDLLTEGQEGAGHGSDHWFVARARHGFDHRGSLKRQLVAI